MNQMKIDASNQSLADKAKLNNIYSGYSGDNADLTKKLIQSGNPEDAITAYMMREGIPVFYLEQLIYRPWC